MRKSNGFSARQLSDDDLHPLLCGVALIYLLPQVFVKYVLRTTFVDDMRKEKTAYTKKGTKGKILKTLLNSHESVCDSFGENKRLIYSINSISKMYSPLIGYFFCIFTAVSYTFSALEVSFSTPM